MSPTGWRRTRTPCNPISRQAWETARIPSCAACSRSISRIFPPLWPNTKGKEVWQSLPLPLAWYQWFRVVKGATFVTVAAQYKSQLSNLMSTLQANQQLGYIWSCIRQCHGSIKILFFFQVWDYFILVFFLLLVLPQKDRNQYKGAQHMWWLHFEKP